MLAITAKVKLLKEEVLSARHVCKDIIGTLEGIKPDSDYRKEIGVYAVQAPDWKILRDEKNHLQQLVRKVCTGEISPTEALAAFQLALNEFEAIDAWLQVPKK